MIYRAFFAAMLLAACAKTEPTREAVPPPPSPSSGPRRIELSVTERGFEPTPIRVSEGEPLKLIVTRKTDNTCATEIVVPDHSIRQPLPLNQPVEIAFTPSRKGELKYGCAMGQMVSGVLLVE